MREKVCVSERQRQCERETESERERERETDRQTERERTERTGPGFFVCFLPVSTPELS